MKIFITGGTGFIGTHLMKRLAATQHELICLTRRTSDCRVLEAAGAKIVEGDVRDKDSLTRGMEGCDRVINLANLFEFWIPDRREFREVNVTGTRNVMEAAHTAGVTKIVHVSTVAIYGNARWPITEESELGPDCASEYALTKRQGDLLAWEIAEEKQLPLVMIYPGAVIGPNDPKACGRYIKNVIRGKMPAQVLVDNMFSFVYVGDVADAIIKALEKDGNIGERYLIVAENHTFGDINRMLTEVSGVKLPKLLMPDWLLMLSAHLCTLLANIIRKPPILDMSVDQMRLMKQGWQIDGSKAVRELGLAYTPLVDALRETVESFKA
jgi:dihydroflavonol-4-reductase